MEAELEVAEMPGGWVDQVEFNRTSMIDSTVNTLSLVKFPECFSFH